MRHTALLLLSSLCASPVLLADGMPDPGFGAGGLVLTNFSPFSNDEVAALAIQPDGRAIAVGRTYPVLPISFMAAARYLPSGALDTSFDGDGLAAVDFGTIPDRSAMALDVLLQPDGRIVLVGFYWDTMTFHYALVRLNADGTLDPSFGTGGKVTVPLAGGAIPGGSAALLADGRILVLARTGSLAPGVALARFTANGALDPTFGTGGHVTVPVPVTFGSQRLMLQPDGKILIVGSAGAGPFDIGLIRLLSTGALDTSFDGDGLVTTDFGANEQGVTLALTGDGRILVAGFRQAAPAVDFAVVRYLASGALDTTFGTGGLATADSGTTEFVAAMLLQPDGKLLVLASDQGPSADFILARFTAGGMHDTTFGTGGFLVTDFGGSEQAHAIALAGPDRVLAAGSALGTSNDFALARYIASTPVEVMSFSVE